MLLLTHFITFVPKSTEETLFVFTEPLAVYLNNCLYVDYLFYRKNMIIIKKKSAVKFEIPRSYTILELIELTKNKSFTNRQALDQIGLISAQFSNLASRSRLNRLLHDEIYQVH